MLVVVVEENNEITQNSFRKKLKYSNVTLTSTLEQKFHGVRLNIFYT